MTAVFLSEGWRDGRLGVSNTIMQRERLCPVDLPYQCDRDMHLGRRQTSEAIDLAMLRSMVLGFQQRRRVVDRNLVPDLKLNTTISGDRPNLDLTSLLH